MTEFNVEDVICHRDVNYPHSVQIIQVVQHSLQLRGGVRVQAQFGLQLGRLRLEGLVVCLKGVQGSFQIFSRLFLQFKFIIDLIYDCLAVTGLDQLAF